MLEECLDLMRRLPPQRTTENLSKLLELCPDLAEDLLSSVDQPLVIRTDRAGRQYLCCDYNRDGDSWRSPWTNEYDPPLSDGAMPSDRLRKVEEAANDAFDVYRDMYYGGGLSSVYLWDTDDGFAGVVLLQKAYVPSEKPDNLLRSTWDSIHVFEMTDKGRSSTVKLTSTVLLHLVRHDPSVGELELGGSMTRQLEQEVTRDSSLPQPHVVCLGRIIEDMEAKMRNLLQEVYFQKSANICNDIRSIQGLAEGKRRADLQGELVGLLRKT
ncbi:uncharacterized protein L969DRAFT_91758 [Mixia osmundae IAM 14324]|uniref:F-actin-capping protein subunit beta n=1 Tax=Mixia osmundae (strain CBS 9802 / IAM 14324 / JCM 22182 / KY 12970) TaxID=764103 RepID=G7EAF7_MIXOS|nr:uncharacterized protein L969DRAFT_91758 [Mixia osmundae IAM 14324]KEI42307.1 hypothetical protein L969DRAFT_91758 [Mixia osmundae IAM 14324]GAA99817.1 hypothetical protein E5Q_06520 [Mixia osmundae IAM 14324]